MKSEITIGDPTGHRGRGARGAIGDRDAGDCPDDGDGGHCRRVRYGATQPANSADGERALTRYPKVFAHFGSVGELRGSRA